MSMSVEDVFDIEIPDETAETLRAVGDLIAYIKAEQHFCFWVVARRELFPRRRGNVLAGLFVAYD